MYIANTLGDQNANADKCEERQMHTPQHNECQLTHKINMPIRMFQRLIAALAILLVATSSSKPVVGSHYGVDCSFPVLDRDLSACGGILGNRTSFYEDYMQGCRDHFGSKAHRCDSTEQDRLDMSRRQPQAMVVGREACGCGMLLTTLSRTIHQQAL